MLKFHSREKQTLSIIYDSFPFSKEPSKIYCPFIAHQVQSEILYHREI